MAVHAWKILSPLPELYGWRVDFSCTIQRDESAVDWGRETEYSQRDVNIR